ncbi:DUF502 domain-containing protein [Methyloterricola oryzae]|uniref:DUF502 domain-containing protein n=1 Tax=Methyloterricola oryzae TaxID=1495050 RepID=UPI00069B74EC|nr:DUF502 domain-containing protein [Methyloterricola oryzae]
MSAVSGGMKAVFNYFLIGTVAILPIFIVMQILFWLTNFTLHAVFNIKEWVGHYWMVAAVLLSVFALLAYIGHEIAKLRQSLIIRMFDLVIGRLPFINSVYRVTKKVIDMFRGQGDQHTREVVYVEYPKDGVWVPAYVTNRQGDRYVLYIPTSPNPTNGFTVILHESKVVKSSLNFEEVTSFVISVGADFPKAQEVTSLPR